MTKPFRVGFCVSGGGRLFRAAATLAPQIQIAPALAVGEMKCAEDLESFCQLRSIDFARLDPKDSSKFDSEITRLCISAELDLLCLTFDRILPRALVEYYRHRIINVHMGLLPAFKGMRALDQAVGSGARFAGATIHDVNELVDNGAIIAQCLIGIRRDDTAASIGLRLFGPLRSMFLQVLRWHSSGRVSRDEHGRIWIENAVYGELPISPSLEDSFED